MRLSAPIIIFACSLILALSLWHAAEASPTTLWLRYPVGSRANAMGAAGVAVAEGVSAMYWNPASLGLERGVETQFGWEPWWYPPWMNRYFAGVTIGVGKPGTAGIGHQRFDLGEWVVTDPYGNVIGVFSDFYYVTTLSYARQLLRNTLFGISGKFVRASHGPSWFFDLPARKGSAWAFDVGALHVVPFFQDSMRVDKLSVAIAVSNLGTAIKYSDSSREDLERMLRIGVGYQGSFRPRLDGYRMEVVGLTVAAEYANVVNDPEWSTLGLGAEVTLLNIFSLRLGQRFALEEIGKQTNRDTRTTWGFGIEVPIHEFSGIPVGLGYDYGRHVGFWAVDDPVHTWFVRYIF